MLPGMGNARIKALDDICANIASTREDINNLKAEEAGYEQTALNQMRKHNKTTWAHNGVTLVRVPGEEKLQVKTTRARTATAENQDDSPDAQSEEAGEDLQAMDAAESGDSGGDEDLT